MPQFRPLLSTLVAGVLTSMLSSSSVNAQGVPFGERGHLVLSAERLTGFVHTSQTITVMGQDMDQSADYFFLLGNPVGSQASGYALPRLALDVFVAPHLTLGAALSFAHLSAEGGDANVFVLAPRVGYAANLTSRVAFWPRVGFTYERASSAGDDGGPELTLSLFALTIEAPLVLMLGSNAALMMGPSLDLGLGGSVSASSGLGGSVSNDAKVTDFGIQGGIALFL